MAFPPRSAPSTEPAAKKRKRPSGPPAERLKIEGNWKEAVKKALKKKRPSSGWPKPESVKKSSQS